MIISGQQNLQGSITSVPQRIVSLVPSLTDLLFDLGCSKQMLACTKFCIHPLPNVKTLHKIGGTKSPKVLKILHMQPDLIIANKEENRHDDVVALASQVPVWVTDINTINDYVNMLHQWRGTIAKANTVTLHLNRLQRLGHSLHKRYKDIRVAYIIWQKPWMAAGSSCFISSVLAYLGFINVFSDFQRYPEISVSSLQELKPDVIMLSSEPFPFKQSHAMQLQKLCPHSKIILVNGELFSWYGSRLLYWNHYHKELDQLLGMFS